MHTSPDSTDIVDQSPQLPKVEKIAFTSTREKDGIFRPTDSVNKDTVDFQTALAHIKIHTEGEAGGSQFDSQKFRKPEDVVSFIQKSLPEKIDLDRFGRAEITLECAEKVGWTGIISLPDLQQNYPGNSSHVEQKVRIPGGIATVENNLSGAWYPEMGKDPMTGKFGTLLDKTGNVKNPRGKFEPEANIAQVKTLPQTNKITVIISKNPKDNTVSMLTLFPGDNAPAFPAIVPTFNIDTTAPDSLESQYWKNHAFVKTNPTLPSAKEAQTAEISKILQGKD